MMCLDLEKNILFQNIAHTVGSQLGKDWKQLAITIGFTSAQLDNLQFYFEVLDLNIAKIWMITEWLRVVGSIYHESTTLLYLNKGLWCIGRLDIIESINGSVDEEIEIDSCIVKCVSQLSLSPYRLTQRNLQIRQAMSRIDMWKEDHVKFVETKAFRECRSFLAKNHFVTIIGKPGDGKTTLARHLVMDMFEAGYQPLIVEILDDLKNLETNQVVFMDDAFGKSQVLPDSYIQQLVSRCYYLDECVRNKRVMLIVTSRDYIYEDCREKLKDILSFNRTADLSNSDLKLDKCERLDLIRKYAPEDTSDSLLEEIADSGFYQSYPIMCRLFGSDNNFQSLKMFSSSLSILLLDRIDYIEKTQPVVYLGLVYLMLLDGIIPVHALDSFSQAIYHSFTGSMDSGLPLSSWWANSGLFNELKLELGLPMVNVAEIKQALEHQVNQMVTCDGRKFSFLHESFVEAVALSFSKKHQRFLIQHCSVECLQQRFSLRQCSSDINFVQIDTVNYSVFARRLNLELQKGNISYLLQNPSLFCGEFVEIWVQELSTYTNKQLKMLMETKDASENNVLFWIQKYGSVHMLKLLLDKDITSPSFLVCAAAEDHLSTVDFLLKCGFDANGRNSVHQTALLAAAEGGQAEMTQLLLTHNADPSLLDKFGQCPLHIAASKGHLDIVALLLRHGVDIDQTCHIGCTALYYACLNGNSKIVEMFLRCGANVNIQNKLGGTAFMAACIKGYSSIVGLLLLHNVNTRALDFEGRSALHWVCLKGYIDILEILKSSSDVCSEDFNVKDKSGHTAIDLAKRNGNTCILLSANHQIN